MDACKLIYGDMITPLPIKILEKSEDDRAAVHEGERKLLIVKLTFKVY
jgi:hypothetical protein